MLMTYIAGARWLHVEEEVFGTPVHVIEAQENTIHVVLEYL